MMWRTGFVSTVVLLCAAGSAFAQSGTITGTVTSTEEGRPLQGVQIRVVGATAGTITRDDGRYSIASVPPGTYTVRATRIGYAPDSTAGVVVTAGAPTTVNFQLQPTTTVL